MRAMALAALVASSALGADGGVPTVVHLDQHYVMNEPAFDKINAELVRLQRLEQTHKNETWVGPLLLAFGLGFGLGAIGCGVAWYASDRARGR